jgi:hypothetical protein
VSGEAGATLESKLYSILVGSGVRVALGPGNAGYFEKERVPFAAWLERARPDLDALFAGSMLPLTPLVAPFEQVDGAIIEARDDKSAHFRQYWGFAVTNRSPRS